MTKMVKLLKIFQLSSYAMCTSRSNYCTFKFPNDQRILNGAKDLVIEKNKIVEIEKKSTDVQVRRAQEKSFKKYAWHTLAIEGIKPKTYQISGAKEASDFIQRNFQFRELDEYTIFHTNSIFTDDENVTYRKENVFVRHPNGTIARNPDFEEVPSLMRKLVSFVNSFGVQSSPIIIGSLFKVYFVMIHPFMDGNGRTSRAFLNGILVQNGFPFICIPAEEIDEYYNVINHFTKRRELLPYFEYIFFCIKRSLKLYSEDLKN